MCCTSINKLHESRKLGKTPSRAVWTRSGITSEAASKNKTEKRVVTFGSQRSQQKRQRGMKDRWRRKRRNDEQLREEQQRGRRKERDD